MSILLLGRKVKIFLDGGNPCVRIADQQMKKQPEKEEIMQESAISREKSKNHIILQSGEKAN